MLLASDLFSQIHSCGREPYPIEITLKPQLLRPSLCIASLKWCDTVWWTEIVRGHASQLSTIMVMCLSRPRNAPLLHQPHPPPACVSWTATCEKMEQVAATGAALFPWRDCDKNWNEMPKNYQNLTKKLFNKFQKTCHVSSPPDTLGIT